MATLAVEALREEVREADAPPRPAVALKLVPDAAPGEATQSVPAAAARAQAQAEAFDTDLPGGLFVAMFALFGAFVMLMFATFAGADAMGVIGVICAICLIGYFGVPFAMHRAAPRPARPRVRTLAGLWRDGIAAGEGHRTSGRDAIGLVLLLPTIILLWGVAVSLVRAILL